MIRLALSLAASLLTSAVMAATGATVATDNVKARLLSETASIAPGSHFTVALELDIRDGWHTYWRNPGDSGQATRLKWTLPPLFTDGAIQWAVPHRFEVPPLVNYGYAHHAMHLVELSAPQDLKPGTLTLAATANWLVCSDICIPESADLQLTVTADPHAHPRLRLRLAISRGLHHRAVPGERHGLQPTGLQLGNRNLPPRPVPRIWMVSRGLAAQVAGSGEA